MAVSVLIVDDSSFFRRRMTEMIEQSPGLEVAGCAANGLEGVQMAIELKPDVITMDYEMPKMDGITAVREIMARQPTPILMFSSLTYEGARVTLEALEAGAVDYLPKNFDDISRNSAELRRMLAERLLTLARSRRRTTAPVVPMPPRLVPSPASRSAAAAPAVPATPLRQRSTDTLKPLRRFGLVAIGTSTGGPVALQSVLSQLPASFPAPLVLVQHMPATFTSAFAERLNSLCKIEVREAQDGDVLRPGLALLAPGGKQMMISRGGKIRIIPGDERLNYKPCVDVTFASAANVFQDQALAIVLTGMGTDGSEGARLLKQHGGTVWAQDEATSVIYGMPMAVARAGLADDILPLTLIGQRLSTMR
ncbi:MAG: chemotaxis response regulator protein-glutamate methylesterase [Spongiibacteraceae bacterium]|jgi:two-component system chemotaxis response regulator CheB|nr:chemotaxis response regulator protein-glutamate methylesterase [Spongiibacteraceae bacterium]